MKKAREEDTSLMSRANLLFARCKPEVVPLADSDLAQYRAWEKSVADPKNVSDLLSFVYSRWVLATRDPKTWKHTLRECMAGCIAAANLVEKRTSVTLDVLLDDSDQELRQLMDDTSALQAVEAASQHTKEAEERVKQLMADKEKLELDLLELQEASAVSAKANRELLESMEDSLRRFEADNKRLREQLDTSKNLSVSKAQELTVLPAVPVSDEPIGVLREGLRLELHKFRCELTESWIADNLARVKERYTHAETVAEVMRLIQQDPAVMTAIGKNPLLVPAFKFAEHVLATIPG